MPASPGRPDFERAAESETDIRNRALRYPHLWGGGPTFRRLTPKQRIAFLQGRGYKSIGDRPRLVSFEPAVPAKTEPFGLRVDLPADDAAEVDFVRFEVVLPSGTTSSFDHRPTPAERRAGRILLEGFESGSAGDLYASARVYLRDGRTVTDAHLTSVLSRNPDSLVVSPRTMLVSGRSGRVEYDWDTNEFHCRAYATITNGSSVTRTYTRCDVRVTDGGVGGTLISAFSFSVGPFAVAPGGSAYRTVDTWYGQGSDVWDKFNRRWDLTVEFTYVAGSTTVSDSAVYRPMTTIPVNLVWCDDYSADQWDDLADAVAMAAEILEDRDITVYNPDWRILSRQSDKDIYGVIDLDWDNGQREYDEADELRERISGPDGERVDVFIPLGFTYSADTPTDKRGVTGFSPRPGPYPKDDDPDDSGLVVRHRVTSTLKLAETIAHELGHYLGLEHTKGDDTNLMFPTTGRVDNRLTWEQWNTVRQHGMAKWLAPDI